MLFSEDKRFVFVAVPKTGTTAIQDRLLKIDPTLRRNTVLDAGGTWRHMATHATAGEIRAVMGSRAADYQFVAFFRDPMEAISSKYHFYRSGRPAKKLRANGLTLKRSRPGKRIPLRLAARIMFSRLTPLRAWAMLYPFKSAAHFLTDGEGRILVDQIGDFGRLQEDVNRIFGALGYRSDDLALDVINRSDVDRASGLNGGLSGLVRLKLRRDLDLYARIQHTRANPAGGVP